MQAHAKPRALTPWMLSLTAAVSLCLFLTACSRQRPQNESQTQQPERYELKGTVISVDKAQKKLVVDHEAIPGFMGAMAMPYPVKDAMILEALGPGDQITAQVVVSGGSVWLENIALARKAKAPWVPSSSDLHEPDEGEQVPNFALVNQDEKRVHFRDYRGQTLLITFIYTRCPFPDFCPLMIHHFAEIERALAKKPEAYAKTHLLCISIDPEYDTPQVLREYGAKYVLQQGKHAFDHWEFAVTSEADKKEITRFFGLTYGTKKGVLVHNVSTAILSPDGRVYKWYDDNTWKPEDALQDLTSLLASQTKK